MKRLLCLIIFLIIFQLSSIAQVNNYNELVDKLKYIELPFKIDSFPRFKKDSCNQVELYNSIIKVGAGYINHKDELRKATGTYPTDTIIRTHEYLEDNEYKHYKVIDSVLVQFIGQVKLSEKVTCILTKIRHVPNDFQLIYYYELLAFDNKGNHLSTIKVFELVDDASTKDWMKEKPSPSITSTFNSDKSFDVTWDGGYEDIYIQYVELNDEGIFEVKKSEEKKVR